MTLRIGSLFAGVGGFDLGFERAGFETAWAVEIDEKAQAVLRLRFPKAALHDDVCAVGAHNLSPVDVITYGFPCTDVSVAGKRAGLEGTRSGLFYEAVRVIRELRERDGKPDIAIAENVPGLFSSKGGDDFEAVLQTLLDSGAKDVAWRVLDSRYHRVAQRRRRVFLVSDFRGERAGEILSLAEGVRGHFEKSGKTREEIASAAGAGIEIGLRIDGTGGGISGAVSCKWAKGTGGPAGDEFYNLVATETVGTLCSDSHPGAYSGQDAYTGRLVPMKAKDSGSHWDDPSNPYPSLNQSNSGTGQVGYSNQEIFSQRGAYLVPGQPIGFNWANGGGYGNAHPGLGITEDDTPPLNCSTVPAVTCVTEERPKPTMAVRRLMPVETEKLQGFPRDWTSEGIDKQGRRIVMADSSRYKQMGNAVTVNVAEAIAHRVRAVLTEGD